MNREAAESATSTQAELAELSRRVKPVMRFRAGLNGLFPEPSGCPYYIAIPNDPAQPLNRYPQPVAPASRLIKLVSIQMTFP